MKILIFLLILTVLIISVWLYFFFKEKRDWRIFFGQLKEDSIFSSLLNKAEKDNFIVEPVSRIFGGKGMTIFLTAKRIFISGNLIGGYLKKRLTTETVRFVFAHELGHRETTRIRTQTRIVCPSAKKFLSSCLLEELMASKKALELLKESGESDLKNYQNSWLICLSPTINKQCPGCFRRITKEKNCPRQEEVKEIGSQIEEMLKIE